MVANAFDAARIKSPTSSAPPFPSASELIVVAPFDVTSSLRVTPVFALNVNVDPAVIVDPASWTTVAPDVILNAASVATAPPSVTEVVASEIVNEPNVKP